MTSGNCQVPVRPSGQALFPASRGAGLRIHSRLAAGRASGSAGNARGPWAFRADLAEDTAVIAGALQVRYRHPLPDRGEDRHALAAQAGRDLAEAVGAV